MAYTTIDKPTDYFNTKLYTGNDSTQSISGVGFQPDWVWIKDRGNATNHMLFDSVRGTGKELHSQNTDSETTQSNTLTAFGSDGFSLGSNADVNNSSQNFASWNWLAGGTASSNTDGSITSSVSASATSGFSIVSYTGSGSNATVGHGLSSAPSMIIFKARGTGNWLVYHQGIGNTHGLFLSTNSAKDDDATYFQDTDPTSSVFSIGTSTLVNDTNPYIAYCFAEKKGYSKFGSYTGNGNADGTFIYTGFKPAWILVKVTSTIDEWNLVDVKRDTTNTGTEHPLFPNSSSAESSGATRFNILSNGFKCTTTNVSCNSSGASYIFMAFAESPFVTSTGIPTTAR